MRKRLGQLVFDRGLQLGLVALIVYLWLAPQHIVAGDNAEFATLGAVGGRAHPSGYPLYVLWLRVTSWIPGASPAHVAALATALLAAVQVVVLHAACRAWGARTTAATLAVATFAAAPLVLRVHTEADVFALNSLVASTILWLAAEAGPLRGNQRAAVLGLVAGLGLANNLTCALLAPIGILGVVRGVREATVKPGVIALAIGGFALGLVPYVYLFVAPDPASWGPVETFGDLADIVLRKDYGYTSHLPGGGTVPLTTSLGAHAALIARTWLWIPAVLGVAMLGVRVARSSDRWGWGMLGASWILAGPVLAARLHVETEGVGGYIGARMQVLSALVLAVPIASGFDLVADRAGRALSSRAGVGLAALGFVVLVTVALPPLVRVHSPAVERGVANLLVPLPKDAIAIVVSEDQCFGARYLQLARDLRPDVTVVCWALTVRDWYRDRLALAGVRIEAQRGGPASVEQGDALLATGRPIFVDRAQTALLAARPNYPFGVLERVLPRETKPPSLGEIIDLNRELFATFDLSYPRPQRGDDFAAVAHLRYAGPWRRIAAALDAAGDRDGATNARALAAELAPSD